VLNYQTKHEDQTHDAASNSWLANIKIPQVYKPLTILFFLFLLQQLSGGYVLIFYTINIFRNLGNNFLMSVDENFASLLLGCIRLLMGILTTIISQKCKRKNLLYLSTCGMAIFSFLVAIKTSTINDSGQKLFLRHSIDQTKIEHQAFSSKMENYMLLISILGYLLFASLGLLIVPWTLIAELFPIKYKARFGGLTVAIAYILMFFVLRTFPFLLENLSISIIFLFFGLASLTCCFFVMFFLPETHRKNLTEIESYFAKVTNN
jgi:MFS family permease